MNYSKYHLWLYTKLNSPNPLPPLGVYTCSRGGEGEGKKVLFMRLAGSSENTELMVLAENHHIDDSHSAQVTQIIAINPCNPVCSAVSIPSNSLFAYLPG